VKIFNDFPQGSPEWLQIRLGVVTASAFDRIMKVNFDVRDGQGYATYLYEKIAETLTGPLPHYGGKATDQGHFLEPEALAFFEMETGIDTKRVGFVLGDDCRCGCSPDALIGEDSGLEIKSPGPVNHIRYLHEGTLPADYAAQVHGSLYVTGRKEWHFMSYHRKLRPFHIVVKRDETIMGRIQKSLAKFYKDFDATIPLVESQKEAA